MQFIQILSESYWKWRDQNELLIYLPVPDFAKAFRSLQTRMQTIIGKDIKKAATLLLQGEIVAIPTETVYGLAANALNETAVLKIYGAKNRPSFNPLIIHVASQNDFRLYTNKIPTKCLLLA